MDDEAWTRLAGAVRARRDELGLKQVELAERAGLSEPTVRVIEGARRSSYQRSTLRALATALGWTPDSADRVLRGDQPLILDPSIDDRIAALEARLGLSSAAPDGRSIEERLDDLERLAESQPGH